MQQIEFHSVNNNLAIKTIDVTRIVHDIQDSIFKLDFENNNEKAFIAAAAYLVEAAIDEFVTHTKPFQKYRNEEPEDFKITPEWVKNELYYQAHISLNAIERSE